MSVETMLSAYMHTHMQSEAPACTSILTISNLSYTQRAANRDLRQMKTAARNGKYGRSIILGKCKSLRVDLNESREGFCQRGRGRSGWVQQVPKTSGFQSSPLGIVVPVWYTLLHQGHIHQNSTEEHQHCYCVGMPETQQYRKVEAGGHRNNAIATYTHQVWTEDDQHWQCVHRS